MTSVGPRRGLVLAGGGIRVAWQTGVVTALAEAGLDFAHVDGSSGGLFTTAMLLSGRSPGEMGERWRALDVRAFVSPLPLRAYLRSPTSWLALGGDRGIRDVVLPGLGIDLDRVRAATRPTGTFNVADFAAKTCVPVPHTEIDEDRLIAGVSLAGVMPAVEAGGRTWTDAVWIKDANLTETVRRGCTEIWLAWCIADTPYFGRGALEQYVHMIEMSAVGGLTAELGWIAEVNDGRRAGRPVGGTTEPVVVHVIRPHLPIPLDPEFVLGRIDAETLIATGYRDAWRYLEQRSDTGVPLDGAPTATPARVLGARLTLRADVDLGDLGRSSCTVVIEADDLASLGTGPRPGCAAVGALRTAASGHRMFRTARVQLADGGRGLTAAADVALVDGASPHRFVLVVDAVGCRGRPALTWTVTDPAGAPVAEARSRLTVRQTLRAVWSFEPAGAHGLRDRVRAVRLALRTWRHGDTTRTAPGR